MPFYFARIACREVQIQAGICTFVHKPGGTRRCVYLYVKLHPINKIFPSPCRAPLYTQYENNCFCMFTAMGQLYMGATTQNTAKGHNAENRGGKTPYQSPYY